MDSAAGHVKACWDGRANKLWSAMQGVDKVRAYFPQGKWYSAFDHSEVDASEGGKHVVLDAPLGAIPVHILEGSILPIGPSATTTAGVRTGPLSLLIALNTTTPAVRLIFKHLLHQGV